MNESHVRILTVTMVPNILKRRWEALINGRIVVCVSVFTHKCVSMPTAGLVYMKKK